MANKSAILSIRIVGDAANAIKAFSETENRAKRMQDIMKRATQISVGVLAGIAATGWEVAQVASQAEQAAGAVESVFKQSADTIKGYAADAASVVGLSASSYNELASVLGAQLTNMGVAGGQLATQTDELIGLGADLAATFGGTTADAVQAVSSLLRGERDPIERYGVSIKQADLDARMAAMGLSDLTGEAERNAQMQATLAILTEQTASAQGQFSREADTAAGAQQRATAAWENAQAELGEALLPVLSELAGMLETVAKWIGENESTVQIFVGVLGGLAAAILVVQAAQIAWNIATSANPILLVITLIAGLVTALITMAGGWDEVGRVAGDILNGIGEGIMAVVEWIQDAIGWLGELLGLSSDASDISVTTRSERPGAYSSSSYVQQQMTSQADAQAAATGDTYNVSVNGAIDVDGTARTVEGVLKKSAKRTGRGVAKDGGTRWR